MNSNHKIPMRFLFLFAVLATILPASAEADEEAKKYQNCMTLAANNPDKAFDAALEWHDMGGGFGADHCAAVALIGLKFHKEGAERLERLAQEINAEKTMKAELLGQAGQAWLLAGAFGRARDVQTAALELDPQSVELLIDRAQAKAADKLYFPAVDDLNRALEIDPARIDALVFRATAYRYLDNFDMALEDVNKALSMHPDQPDALLEKGNLHRLKGENDLARQAWIDLLEAAPGSPAALAAQANLEKMDVKK